MKLAIEGVFVQIDNKSYWLKTNLSNLMPNQQEQIDNEILRLENKRNEHFCCIWFIFSIYINIKIKIEI